MVFARWGETVNIIEIEKKLNILVESIEREDFIYSLLEAYDFPKSAIARAKKSALNKLDTCLVWGGCPNNFISFSPKHIRRFIKNLRFNSIPFYDSVKWCFHF
jgi:hypothetical protein